MIESVHAGLTRNLRQIAAGERVLTIADVLRTAATTIERLEQDLESCGRGSRAVGEREPRKSGAQRKREALELRVELSRLRATQRRRGVSVPTDLNGGGLAGIPRGRQGVARQRGKSS